MQDVKAKTTIISTDHKAVIAKTILKFKKQKFIMKYEKLI